MSTRLQATLTQFEREITQFLARVRSLEEISVSDAAKLLKTSRKWVRDNLPVIVHSQRSRHVRIVDIEEFQKRLTLLPPATTPTGRPRRTRW
jgi:hypothetical protein